PILDPGARPSVVQGRYQLPLESGRWTVRSAIRAGEHCCDIGHEIEQVLHVPESSILRVTAKCGLEVVAFISFYGEVNELPSSTLSPEHSGGDDLHHHRRMGYRSSIGTCP